ncbi:multisubunit potassium/proton antiporter PhaD subunit [Rhodovulum imhoffii]|uniref:Multisubunit potassium/proton antiporter PhaD subunit n=1 Tax=Rhodovulum imhoffii TaxID=365340 RepID=A0A2T5BVJ1_9RHOB|nr:monovalent cation/H+ antiporter subunit D [Rhodovulum imhoffii]MBK5932837.1 monovalent cation/H+ antiporter subunit D [Rhodovulum imhoffii]PTN03594.1 multisubunit potassium/proton antiporter PhaD subunit [Rhodovulum imhoffii]
MNHWIIAPVIVPALIAALIVLSMRNQLMLQRIFSAFSTALLLAISLGLAWQAADGTITSYELGNWPAPFGIVLVLDRLSALMAVLTSVLALPVLLYAIGSEWDSRGTHFHALFQFQLMGIFGAFLTGDAFNLFVFFEVLLIASYGLMIHGGGTRRLRAGVQYVVFNLLGSTLFLFALGTLYAVTGTLNMADMAARVAEIPAAESAMLRVGAVLLLLVFAIKAALLPLHFWLPATYAEAPAPIAALFAIMTKVGAYAILRMHTLVFGPEIDITADIIGQLVLGAGLITLAIGMVGILGATGLGRMAAFAVIGSMGTLMVGMAGFTEQTTSATLYYLVHSTLAGAAMFLVVDLVRERRADDGLHPGPAMGQHGLVTALFFGAAIAVAGMPPLSGFIGKLLILDAVRDLPEVWAIWSVILVTSLIAIVGLARAGSVVFWKTETGPTGRRLRARQQPKLPLVVTCGMMGTVALLAVFAGPMSAYLDATAQQLFDREAYISAVLPEGGQP